MGQLEELEFTPESHLEAIVGFLDRTAEITLEQAHLLEMMRSFLPAEAQLEYEQKISQEVDKNIQVVGRYVTDLAEQGIRVCVKRSASEPLPLMSLKFSSWDACYSVSVQTKDGVVDWPLNGDYELVVRKS